MSGSRSKSALIKNPGSGSALNQCRSAALVLCSNYIYAVPVYLNIYFNMRDKGAQNLECLFCNGSGSAPVCCIREKKTSTILKLRNYFCRDHLSPYLEYFCAAISYAYSRYFLVFSFPFCLESHPMGNIVTVLITPRYFMNLCMICLSTQGGGGSGPGVRLPVAPFWGRVRRHAH
jgi:hypothetical protein